MSKLRDAAQQALEALEDHAKQYPHMQKGYTVDAITALRAALAEPDHFVDASNMVAEQQEPVAWMQESTEVIRSDWGFDKRGYIPLYAAPQPRRNVTYVCPVCAASLERQE